MTPRKRATLRIVTRKFLKRSLKTRDLSLSFARNGVVKRDMIASVAKGSKQERMMKLENSFNLFKFKFKIKDR